MDENTIEVMPTEEVATEKTVVAPAVLEVGSIEPSVEEVPVVETPAPTEPGA